jgi:DNA modification methylase
MKGNTFYKKRYNKQNDSQNNYGHRENISKSFTSEDEGHTGKYPTTFLEFPVRKDKTGINRTDEMMDFFIKTYSNEGDYVLDMTCHNDYTSKRCNELKRNFLGIDIHLV